MSDERGQLTQLKRWDEILIIVKLHCLMDMAQSAPYLMSRGSIWSTLTHLNQF